MEEIAKLRKLQSPVVFFCAEYAIDDDSEMYAGGLGVLAGDIVLEAGDEEMPFLAIGLWYSGPHSVTRKDKYPTLMSGTKPLFIEIPCGEKSIKAKVRIRSFGDSTWLALLDTDIEDNKPEFRNILKHIYDVDPETRMKQEMVLGIGGVRLIEALTIRPRKYHLNEGHTAYAALQLVVREAMRSQDKDMSRNIIEATKWAREHVIATKHTIFPEAGAWVREEVFTRLLGPYCIGKGIDPKDVYKIGTETNSQGFSTTHFLLNTSGRQNGVSILHVQFEKEAHPSSSLIPVTNGVFQKRWQTKEFQKDIEGWSDAELWKIKSSLRKDLVDFVNTSTGSTLSPDTCTVVWARRFAAYKQPELLFTDLERLNKIANGTKPIQFIISGKAHPADINGTKMVEHIKNLAHDPKWAGKLAYLPDYSISITEKLAKGADVWLNTPIRGKEACGTSGMKASLNGALQMSISDGWVGEVDWKDIGWILPEANTAQAIYDCFEKEVAPDFYASKIQSKSGKQENGLPIDWVKRMRATISIVAKGFTAKRMLADYIEKMYN